MLERFPIRPLCLCASVVHFDDRSQIMKPFLFFVSVVLFARLNAAALSPEEQKIVARVDAHREDFARDLQEAVMVDSATENLAGVRKMAEVFGRQLTALGFESRFVELPASTGRSG